MSKITQIVNAILTKLDRADPAGYIVGGFAVDTYLDKLPRDLDVCIFETDSFYQLVDILTLDEYAFKVVPYYEGDVGIEWCIKANIQGIAVDFIKWQNAYDLASCMQRFDFDVNQAWITREGCVAVTDACMKAHESKVATVNKHHIGITSERLSRMNTKFYGYKFQ